jgi:peptidoglycan/LPS O-acetylase OafA/YrhL
VIKSPALTPPPGNRNFPLMDALRGIALVFVVFGHTYDHTIGGLSGRFLSQGDVAIDVFFALSGFLLFRPYVRARAIGVPEPTAWDFYQRRAFRVLPGYWFALTVCALLFGPTLVPGVFSTNWWHYYSFAQIYFPPHQYDGIAVAWTLSVDMAFYLILPLIALFTRWLGQRFGWVRGLLYPLVGLSIVSVVFRLLETLPNVFGSQEPVVYFRSLLVTEFAYFAMGMIMAVLSVWSEHNGVPTRLLRGLTRRPLLCWGLAAATYAVMCTYVMIIATPFNTPIPLPWIGPLSLPVLTVLNELLALIFTWLVFMPAMFDDIAGLPHRILSWRWLTYLGVVGYGTYLWHDSINLWLVHHTIFRAASSWPVWISWPSQFVVILVLAVAAGSLSYYVVELPFLKRKRGIRRTHPLSVEVRR